MALEKKIHGSFMSISWDFYGTKVGSDIHCNILARDNVGTLYCEYAYLNSIAHFM